MANPEQIQPPTPLNTVFEALAAYNEHKERKGEAGEYMVHLMGVLGAEATLTEAGIPKIEAQESVDAVEGAAMDADRDLRVGLADLQFGDSARAAGLKIVDSIFGYLDLALADGHQFGRTLAAAHIGELNQAASEGIARILGGAADRVSTHGVAREFPHVISRYPAVEAVLEDGYGGIAYANTPEDAELTEQLLVSVAAFGPELERLDVATEEVTTIKALAQAEADGVLAEYGLLGLMGAFETDPDLLYNSFIGNWYDADQWQPLEAVVNGLRTNHPRQSYASLADLLPRTLEKIINPEPREDRSAHMLETARAEDPEFADLLESIDAISQSTPEEEAMEAAYRQFLVERQLQYSLL